MTDHATAAVLPADAEHAGYAHAVPVPVLLTVFAVLIFLTGVTVAATWINLGSWSLVVAVAIATVKATLVAMYFMHLRYDTPFYAFIFLFGLVCLALFLVLTLIDMDQIQPAADAFRSVFPQESPVK